MARYRAKPVEIEAVRWDGAQFLELPRWLAEALAKAPHEPGCVFIINQLAFAWSYVGSVPVRAGEFLVRDADGWFEVMEPAEFRRVYEPVADAPAADAEAA